MIILINFFLVVLASVIFAFFIIKIEYQAQITFLPPAGESSGSFSIMGISLPSLSGGSILTEQIETIFNSKAIKRQIIEKFNLYKVFEIAKSKNKFEQTVKILKKYLTIQATEKGSMGLEKTISYTLTTFHPSPDSAKMMCDFAFSLLDSAVRNISMNRAHRNRLYIENQITLNKERLDSLQKAFSGFQVTNKAFMVPEQIQMALKTYAEVKSLSLYNELKIKAIQQQFNSAVPELEELQKNSKLYNQKLSQMENDSVPGVLPSLGYSAKILPRYLNLMRESEVQNQVLLLLSKEFEQARLQEAKNVSSLIVVDPAYVPEYKSRPKRLFVMLGIIIIEHLFLFLLLAYQYYFSTVVMNDEKFRSFVQAMKSSKR